MDPITILAACTAVWNGIKKASEFAQEAEGVCSQLSKYPGLADQLHQHINTNDHQNATVIINKFKKAVMKNDPAQHANQFLLDCLKTKHEKMLMELEHMREDKKNMEQIMLKVRIRISIAMI